MLGKILDFGLAKFYEPTDGDGENVRLTREGALFGTPAYMSPEQAKGQGGVDHRADLWALGCIVYECLTGQTVWNVDQGVAMILAQIAGAPIPRPSRLRPDLPENVRHLVSQGARPRSEPALPDRQGVRRHAGRSTAGRCRGRTRPFPAQRGRRRGPRPADRATPAPRSGRSSRPAAATAAAARRDPHLAPGFAQLGPRHPVLLLFAAVGLGAYAVWLYVLYPPYTQTVPRAWGRRLGRRGWQRRSGEARAARSRSVRAPDRGRAAGACATASAKDAVALFKEAFNNGGSNVARALAATPTRGARSQRGQMPGQRARSPAAILPGDRFLAADDRGNVGGTSSLPGSTTTRTPGKNRDFPCCSTPRCAA